MPNWSALGAMLFPNLGGWAGALTMAGQTKQPDGKAWYQTLKKPSWTPPNWVFGPAWTALYTGMGYASYMVYRDCGGMTDKAILPIALYGGQLIFNWTWTPVFFKMHLVGLAFFHITALDVAAAACALSFYEVNPTTAWFMLPYLAWLGFATCLNYSIWQLNKKDNEKKVVPL
ncbi:translocator protein-like [Cydia fagiglandana]|uniref:translocator protein-like n=1 Tax=Cydia fagiglandana TaxID=1458189 RepID=UPI002FEE2F6A